MLNGLGRRGQGQSFSPYEHGNHLHKGGKLLDKLRNWDSQKRLLYGISYCYQDTPPHVYKQTGKN